jgi:hypothetical protein
MDLLIPVVMAAASLLVLCQIAFAGCAVRDRGIRNPDLGRPRSGR